MAPQTVCPEGPNGFQTYTWEEVGKHNNRDDKWLVVDGNVYDISRFMKKHPGGARIISHFAGQDATVSPVCVIMVLVKVRVRYVTWDQ